MTAVIEAASAGVKDMADGSLRITFEFDPRHAAEAFALFGPRGRAVAIAALKDGSAAIPDMGIPISEKPKGGEQAKLAGMWCNDPDFWRFCALQWEEVITNSESASVLMREMVGIASRSELDHDEAALRRFNAVVRQPFMAWMKANGISK